MGEGLASQTTVLAVSDLLIRAAGGVVVRAVDETPCVLVVHRPRYDDWSLPKGKADGDEADEATALREVEEETGYICRLAGEVTTSHYVDRKGRPKRVRWYRMDLVDDLGFEPDDEVDERRWVPVADADALLTYERERSVLALVDWI